MYSMQEDKYIVVQGTYYHKDTPQQVIDILEGSRISTHRLKFHYGDIKTGKAWGDVAIGHVGRSNGQIKIPLLIKTSRSTGGEGLLDNCIVKIEHANKKYSKAILFDVTKK